jgi:hypothetical protein
MTAEERTAAVAALTDEDPSTVKGWAVVIDNGTTEAVVATDMEQIKCGAILYQAGELLITGRPS